MASKNIHAKRAARVRANNASGVSGYKKAYNQNTQSTKRAEVNRLMQKYAESKKKGN